MIAPCLGFTSQKHRGKPFLLTISVLGSVTCITQHTGPTGIALRPIRRTKQGHKHRHRESYPHSGFLTTPELEAGALNRSAMTLHMPVLGLYSQVILHSSTATCIHAAVARCSCTLQLHTGQGNTCT